MINDVVITPLSIINVLGGDVLHAMKCTDAGFYGFGEAYFSTIKQGAIKAWQRHRKMVLNLIVPVGSVRFVVHDDRPSSTTSGRYWEVVLSHKNYCRLTVPPMLWVGFKGESEGDAMLLNIASISHDQYEVDRNEIDEFEYDWS